MLPFSIYTLGCKLNQLESEAVAGAFARRGFPVVSWDGAGEEPCILVLNTCTVTSKAEQKARRLIRNVLRARPLSCLIITGCYAQLEAAVLESLREDLGGDQNRFFILSGTRKGNLLELPQFILDASGGLEACSGRLYSEPEFLPSLIQAWYEGKKTLPRPDPFCFVPGDFLFHSRAFLKIQDGCDRRCSYCRVSLARGPGVSLAAEAALALLRDLEARGYGEAVLTGVNIHLYRSGGLDLGKLLGYLLDNTKKIALRLSSTEPEGLKDDFIKVLENPRIRPHFHLSLQSGSPRVLERMRRPYTPEAVERGIGLLRSLRGDPFLACDIIAGFPGETPEDFEKTYEFCRRIGFSWIHPFPYSRRPGTEAYGFQGAVPEREAVLRVNRLLGLAREGRRAYISRWMGKQVDAVIEDPGKGDAPFIPAVSDNYLKLLIPRDSDFSPSPGSSLRCRICPFPGGEGAPDYARFDAAAERIQ
ncbi:MAG: radical SAM protein [Treponema sp.]|jgi:threonylcarbamoyladenosine tRNA methylthiotransferase MtaB|nr:radical SAM protein [Treponema sp.]